jgi:hypothetical protein
VSESEGVRAVTQESQCERVREREISLDEFV